MKSISPAQLDKTVRFLNSVNGTDKTLMVVQYASKILAWYYDKRGSTLSGNVRALSGPVSDFRILLRYYGLLPLLQYHRSVELSPPRSKGLQTVLRLQNLSMVLYYPLEHLYWLAAHQVVNLKGRTVDRIGYWSCRFWAIYVLLEYARLAYARRDRQAREASLGGSDGENKGQKRAFRKEREQWWVSFCINTAYLPLTAHWSIEGSTFPDVAVGAFGTIAAVLQFRNAWASA